MNLVCRFVFFCAAVALVGAAAMATTVTSDSILISTGGSVYEFTPAGEQVQVLEVPELAGFAAEARDVVVHSSGQLLVFNGTFTPSLSTYDPVADLWQHQTFTGWGTSNSVGYGGIAAAGRFVYVSDSTVGAGDPGGVVRFDRQGGPTIRSSVSRSALDVAIGLDGWLYTLNTSAPIVSVFDPQTLAHVRDVHVPGDGKGLAVDFDGTMFIVASGNQLKRVAADGTTLEVQTLPNAGTLTAYHHDIDLRPDGAILVGQRWGSVIQTDRDFSFATAFQGPSTSPNFVAFATPVPEPAALVLLIGAAVGYLWASSRPNRFIFL